MIESSFSQYHCYSSKRTGQQMIAEESLASAGVISSSTGRNWELRAESRIFPFRSISSFLARHLRARRRGAITIARQRATGPGVADACPTT